MKYDEAILFQFIISNMAWHGPENEMPIIPKDDGISLMVSEFPT